MKCPKDGAVLERLTAHEVVIDQCAVCKGVWLDNHEIAALLRVFAQDHENTYVPPQDRTEGIMSPAEFWQETVLQCPRDGTTLKKHFFAGDSGIGIDQCLQCRGIWLDGDELMAVRAHVAPNHRLDRAVVGFARYDNLETKWPHDVGETNFIEAINKPEVAAKQLVERALEFIKLILVRGVLKM